MVLSTSYKKYSKQTVFQRYHVLNCAVDSNTSTTKANSAKEDGGRSYYSPEVATKTAAGK